MEWSEIDLNNDKNGNNNNKLGDRKRIIVMRQLPNKMPFSFYSKQQWETNTPCSGEKRPELTKTHTLWPAIYALVTQLYDRMQKSWNRRYAIYGRTVLSECMKCTFPRVQKFCKFFALSIHSLDLSLVGILIFCFGFVFCCFNDAYIKDKWNVFFVHV